MEFVILGVVGFAMLFGSDLCGVRNNCIGRNFLAFFGVLFLFGSSIYILIIGQTIELSIATRIVSGFLTIVFLFLLVYSVGIEVNKKRDEKDKLLTTGTYALTRHPGVIWFLLYYVFGALMFANMTILIAGIIWSFVNVIYVLLQEKVIFNKIFDNYDMYIKTTPMLFPTVKSVKRCVHTLNGGQNERFTSNV